MPSKHDPFRFDITGDPPMFTGIESYQCPNCHYRIPILTEHIDYRELYEKYAQYMEAMKDVYEALISECCRTNIGAKVFFDAQKIELKGKIELLKHKYFRGDFEGK